MESTSKAYSEDGNLEQPRNQHVHLRRRYVAFDGAFGLSAG